MPHDRDAVPAHPPARIEIPDQVQQARRPDETRHDEPRRGETPADQGRPAGGILQELRTERAHD